MIMHKPEANPEASKKADFHNLQQRHLLTRLDKKNFDISNKHTGTSFDRHSMPAIKSSSLDVLTKVMSQQNQKTTDQKLDVIMDEIRRVRQESKEQIEQLTQEIERLDKRSKEQQDDIDDLLNENADVKERLYSFYSSLLAKLCEDSNSYRSNNMINSNSYDMLTDTATNKVSELRSIFETETVGSDERDNSNSVDVTDGPLFSRKQETSSYVNNYLENIDKNSSNSDRNADGTIKYKTRSVSDLREYFENASKNRERSKSFSGPNEVHQHLQLALPAEVVNTEDDESRVESAENTSFHSVSDLKALFESKSTRNRLNRASCDDMDTSRKFSTDDHDRRKSTSGTVDNKVENLEGRPSSYYSTFQWTPNIVF